MANECYWKDLGQVNGPGKYRVNGFGLVEVTQEDINDAKQLGGNILLKLIAVDTATSRVPEFRISQFTPVSDTHGQMVF